MRFYIALSYICVLLGLKVYREHKPGVSGGKSHEMRDVGIRTAFRHVVRIGRNSFQLIDSVISLKVRVSHHTPLMVQNAVPGEPGAPSLCRIEALKY